MEPCIRPVSEADWSAVTAIFNHFVAHSFAAYPEEPLDEAIFRARAAAQPEYPFLVAEVAGRVVGFAWLAPFHPAATLRRSATLTYFLDPDHTGRGIGSALLERLLAHGRALGVRSFLAHVSSRNPGSLRFHLKHGFTECGRFRDAGVKHGERFDVVWFQRLES